MEKGKSASVDQSILNQEKYSGLPREYRRLTRRWEMPEARHGNHSITTQGGEKSPVKKITFTTTGTLGGE